MEITWTTVIPIASGALPVLAAVYHLLHGRFKALWMADIDAKFVIFERTLQQRMEQNQRELTDKLSYEVRLISKEIETLSTATLTLKQIIERYQEQHTITQIEFARIIERLESINKRLITIETRLEEKG